MDVLSSLNFTLLLTAIPFYITGFVGNVLVIRIVHKTREMHTATNYLLANLAVSDVITIFIYPLYVSSYLYGYLNDGFAAIFACKFLVLTQNFGNGLGFNSDSVGNRKVSRDTETLQKRFIVE